MERRIGREFQIADLVRRNTKYFTRFTRSALHHCTSLELQDREGDPTFCIDGECDDFNRAVLDEIYRLALAGDVEAEEEIGIPGTAEYMKQVLRQTPHGFSFVEITQKHDQGTSFRVICESDAIATTG